MAETPVRDDVATFCTMFTRAIIAWNNAEDSVRNILEGLSNASLGSTIAIRQLGNTSLQDAILVVAQMLDSLGNNESKAQADHLRHLVQGFDILRVYRNFYVHNIRAMGKSDGADGEFAGMLHTIEVQGKYSWVQQDLTIRELRNFTQSLMELSQYASDIRDNIRPKNALMRLVRTPKPLSSLQKPTWPDKLSKNRENLIKPLPPPQS